MASNTDELIKEQLLLSINECKMAVAQLQKETSIAFMISAASLIAKSLKSGGKVLIAGNGGSLCDAAHFAEELTGVFRTKRKALPAISLSDPGHLTCVANDIGFDSVFSRGVEAFGKEGDVFIGMTTSGNSLNIVNAVQKALEMGLETITFLGKGGGRLKGIADLELIIESFNTSDRIQEAHMAAAHMIIELLEYRMFPEILKIQQKERDGICHKFICEASVKDAWITPTTLDAPRKKKRDPTIETLLDPQV